MYSIELGIFLLMAFGSGSIFMLSLAKAMSIVRIKLETIPQIKKK